MHPLNLLYVSFSNAWGGLEMKLVEIGAAMAVKGHHVAFVAPAGSPMLAQCATRGLTARAVTPHMRYLDMFAALRLRAIIRRHGADIITVSQSRDISTCLLARIVAGRGALLFHQQMQSGGGKTDWFHRWTYGNLAAWVTLTHEMKRVALTHRVVAADRIHVIPFGSDLKRFDPSLYDRTHVHSDFKIPAGRFVITIIGRLDPQKGQEHVVRALPRIRNRFPSVYLLIVGEDTKGEHSYGTTLRRLVAQLGLESDVLFLGHSDAIPELLSASDLFVLPSLSETFGYVLVEAMAMGVPVIGTNAGGVPEIIEEGRTGLLASPADPADLAEKIERLIGDDSLRTELANAGRRRAVEEFDFRKNIDALEVVYQRIVSKN